MRFAVSLFLDGLNKFVCASSISTGLMKVSFFCYRSAVSEKYVKISTKRCTKFIGKGKFNVDNKTIGP